MSFFIYHKPLSETILPFYIINTFFAFGKEMQKKKKKQAYREASPEPSSQKLDKMAGDE
jgi:hypothetical protein